MSALTAALFAALTVYLGGWFLGFWIGNFSLLLFILTVVTFVYWLAERFKFLPERQAAAQAVAQADAARRTRHPGHLALQAQFHQRDSSEPMRSLAKATFFFVQAISSVPRATCSTKWPR